MIALELPATVLPSQVVEWDEILAHTVELTAQPAGPLLADDDPTVDPRAAAAASPAFFEPWEVRIDVRKVVAPPASASASAAAAMARGPRTQAYGSVLLNLAEFARDGEGERRCRCEFDLD